MHSFVLSSCYAESGQLDPDLQVNLELILTYPLLGYLEKRDNEGRQTQPLR